MPLPLRIPFGLVTKTIFKTSPQGAQTTIHLASSDEVKEVSGKYFMDSKDATSSLKAYVTDVEKCKILWEESCKFCKFSENDPNI